MRCEIFVDYKFFDALDLQPQCEDNCFNCYKCLKCYDGWNCYDKEKCKNIRCEWIVNFGSKEDASEFIDSRNTWDSYL